MFGRHILAMILNVIFGGGAVITLIVGLIQLINAFTTGDWSGVIQALIVFAVFAALEIVTVVAAMANMFFGMKNMF